MEYALRWTGKELQSGAENTIKPESHTLCPVEFHLCFICKADLPGCRKTGSYLLWNNIHKDHQAQHSFYKPLQRIHLSRHLSLGYCLLKHIAAHHCFHRKQRLRDRQECFLQVQEAQKGYHRNRPDTDKLRSFPRSQKGMHDHDQKLKA